MSKLLDELSQLKKAYDIKLAKEGKAAVKEAFKETFAKFPEIECIWWEQYTPYYNDGDVCTFRVGDLHVSLFNPDEPLEEEDYGYDSEHDVWSLQESTDPKQKEIGNAMEALADDLPDDVLLSVFGNHVKVIATPKGFTIRDYEHD